MPLKNTSPAAPSSTSTITGTAARAQIHRHPGEAPADGLPTTQPSPRRHDDGPLESIGKAVTAPIRNAADDEEMIDLPQNKPSTSGSAGR